MNARAIGAPNRLTFAAVALSFLVAACGAGSDYTEHGYASDRREEAMESARTNLDGATYQDQHGSFGCTDDCSGHDAGYQWAQDNEIEDASDCGGNSRSFMEGCEAYAEDLDGELDDVDDSYDDTREEW